MRVLGIDPGVKGGYAIVTQTGKLHTCETFPLVGGKDISFLKLMKKFQALSISFDAIFIEKVHGIWGTPPRSAFTFGCNYQVAKDAAISTHKPMEEVLPIVWQKELFAGEDIIYRNLKSGKKKDTKKMAAIKAHKLWPNFDFLSSKRATKPHDGMIDAALIAYYGFKQTQKGGE